MLCELICKIYFQENESRQTKRNLEYTLNDRVIKVLDVSVADSLKILYCPANGLDTIILSEKADLIEFNCQWNNLSAIDVTHCEGLENLDCSANRLIQLDISNNTILRNLCCQHNKLIHLDISTNTFLQILWIGLMPSLYRVCVWDGFNKESSSIDIWTDGSHNVYFTTECSTVFIQPQSNIEESLNLYPNPTNNLLNLEFETLIHGELEIHNLNGQVIYRRPVQSVAEQIDMTRYPKGIYFVTVRSESWVRSVKVVRY